MSALIIPLQPLADQTIQVFLGGQNCTIRVYQRRYGLFVDLYINNTLVRSGMEALNLVQIVRDPYLGFVGNIYFFDTQGTLDPTYDGLGGRFVFLYDPDLVAGP